MVLAWQVFLLWLALLPVPYGMFPVAWYFESRDIGSGVPIWRDQSKAFVPGDAGLVLATAIGILLARDQGLPGWSSTWWWYTLSILAPLGALYVGRRLLYNKDSYTKRQWNSPSKWYHDVVMFGMFPAVAFVYIFPMYWPVWPEGGAPVRITGLLGIVLWLSGLVWDAIFKQVPNPRQHPEHYERRRLFG